MSRRFRQSSSKQRNSNSWENERRCRELLESPTKTDQEKRDLKKSKQNFDDGYSKACRDFQQQVKTFAENYVLLEGSCKKYGDEKYLPRNFTLYSLVQRHLLREELTKNNRGYSFYWGLPLVPMWTGRVQWPRPLKTLSMVFPSLTHNIADVQDSSATDKLLGEIHTSLALHRDSCRADRACLKLRFPALPPLLVNDLFNFLLYFCFEDLLIFSQRPQLNPDFIDMPFNYFYYVFTEQQELLDQLPCLPWYP